MGLYFIEVSTLPCEEGLSPHFTEVETDVQGEGKTTEATKPVSGRASRDPSLLTPERDSYWV